MSLYHKYRPKSFDEIIGNEITVSSLKRMLSKETPHSILFTGGTGCGKTTLARIVAKELGAYDEDILELDSAHFRGIDTIRELRKQVQYAPMKSKVRVWIIDECHKLSNDAQNAFLKTLEDTPKHVYFILCTTDPQKLIPTIKGRCQTFEVHPLKEREIFKLLRNIVKGEGEKISRNIYTQIMGDSLGHPRNAIQILEKVFSVEEDKRQEVAEKTAEQQNQSIELCRALIKQTSWNKVSKILQGLKTEDPEGIRRHVLAYLQSVLLSGQNDVAAAIMEDFLEPFYNTGFPGLVYACYSAVNG